MHRLQCYILILLPLLFIACEDEADVPAYLVVEAPQIIIEQDEGTSFQALTENYVRHNNAFLGAISFGKRIPVLADGPDEIVTFGGVRQNGISSLPSIYFPMSADTFRADFVPGETLTFTPTYRYIDNVRFNFIQDFESGLFFTRDEDGNTGTQMTLAPGEGFGGSTAGRLSVTEDDPIVTVATEDGYTTFSDVGDIYLELTYKNDVNMAVGLLSVDPATGRSQQVSGLFLFPSEEYSKVYVELSRQIRAAPFDRIHIVLSIIHDGREGVAEAFVDDLKLLYLQ